MLLKILPVAVYTNPLSVQATLTTDWSQVRVKVTLRLTVSQSVSLGVEPQDIYCCLTVRVLFLWSALSDERTGLSFVYAAGPCQFSLSRVQVLGTQIWDFPFRHLLRLAGTQWKYSTPPPHGVVTLWLYPLRLTPWHGPHWKHRF
jgi:hypothetical protein